ncbi:signal recognition particle subunit srp19 [Podospora australis]|uniref:Signal recognition particle subunit srp19 n=1 Tax=Podospora australis TaxID=1536484 RepID=A0AAN6WWH3_9PEZI|nr:signal recognition particle subunit srp19 [Podospora australis]
MSHPRVEEVSDSDDDARSLSDPSEDDITDFLETDIIRTRNNAAAAAPPPPSTSSRPQPRDDFLPPLPQPQGYPSMPTTTDDSAYKNFHCLYPVYFDASRSRAEGRRVSSSLAVMNPLAAEIVHACANLHIPTVLEAGKLHPKDWANPGRVKVSLKDAPHIKNKHHLYILIAKHLKANPAHDNAPALRVVVRGAPPPPELKPGEKWPRPAVPRGWKMNELLPSYSPAMTGGGVSENFLKDMMSQMGGAGGPGLPGGGPGGMDMASLLQGMAGGLGGMGGGGGAPGPSSSSGGGKKEKKGKR